MKPHTPVVPILTVLVDYGFAPFLWLQDTGSPGIGENICDGVAWHQDSSPMSKRLWREFANWANEFDATEFYSDRFDSSDWDWLAFHARGLQLSRQLKEEVGAAYRVVYQKPVEDPNCTFEETREVLAEGSLMDLLREHRHQPHRIAHLQWIISGGQTGVDRAALDFAIDHRYLHTGWAPIGRLSEDGTIPKKYQLHELEIGGYRRRTHLNIKDSDATLIINSGELDGGTLETYRFAHRVRRPVLLIQVDGGAIEDQVSQILDWLRACSVQRLNVAGPRESKRPGVYQRTRELLAAAHQRAAMEEQAEVERHQERNSG